MAVPVTSHRSVGWGHILHTHTRSSWRQTGFIRFFWGIGGSFAPFLPRFQRCSTLIGSTGGRRGERGVFWNTSGGDLTDLVAWTNFWLSGYIWRPFEGSVGIFWDLFQDSFEGSLGGISWRGSLPPLPTGPWGFFEACNPLAGDPQGSVGILFGLLKTVEGSLGGTLPPLSRDRRVPFSKLSLEIFKHIFGDDIFDPEDIS